MSRPPRLLMVSPNYHPVMGGVETHLREVTPRLAAAGMEVTVLTTDRTHRLPGSESEGAVSVRRVRAWPRSRDYYVAPGLWGAIRDGDWDLVHIHSYQTAVAPLAMLASISRRLPFLLTFHSGGHPSAMRTRLRPLQQGVLAPLVRRARRFIAVSPFEVRLFTKTMGLPATRWEVIPNGASLPPPSPGVAPRPSEPLIVSVGRLERSKGHQHAIAAMPAVLRHEPAARLAVVGAGPFHDELVQQAEALGLGERVQVTALPPGDRQAMSDLLAAASLVVLFSDYEANPVAIMEALALGRPVLAAHNSGLADLADQGLIRSIPSGADAERTASEMLDALRARDQGDAISLPDWDDCATALLRVYRQVLAAG